MQNGSGQNTNAPAPPPKPAAAKPSPYFARSKTPISGPGKWALLTIGAPLLALALAYVLLLTINIHGPAGTEYAALTHKAVRTAIQESLTRDLASERLQGVLLETADAPPPPPPATKPDKPEEPAAAAARRKTERTERFKPAATRLAGDVARLADMLTVQLMTPRPTIDRQQTVDSKAWLKGEVDKRLTDEKVGEQVQAWVRQTLDPYAASSAQRAMAKAESIETSVASAVAAGRLRTAVTDAITPSLAPFEVRTGAPLWAADISAIWHLSRSFGSLRRCCRCSPASSPG